MWATDRTWEEEKYRSFKKLLTPTVQKENINSLFSSRLLHLSSPLSSNMPKTVTLIAGLVVVSAVAYQFKEDIEKETRTIQHLQALSSSNDTNEKNDSLNTISQFSLANSQHYVKQRLIPSGKNRMLCPSPW